MSLNNTPSAERVHISFLGKRNVGKSSVMNAVTGQDLAVVSDVKGTTTDPVHKAMELLPIGPVMMIDTPGMDDVGDLGALRVGKSNQILRKTDVAVLVADAQTGLTAEDNALIKSFQKEGIRYIIALNKADLRVPRPAPGENEIWISAKTGENIDALKERLAQLAVLEESKLRIVGDLIAPSDFVVLVVPIDKAAPKGRLILPQQQTIRDILETDATAVVVKEHELKETLENLGKKPRMVICDSQVFAKVSADTPKDILLTSFSILFARYKGDLQTAVLGAKAIETLRDGDRVLIAEGCTHHRQCDDIGTVKIPRWIKQHTGTDIRFSYVSGTEFPNDLSLYKMIVHCGGCMLNEREMKSRIRSAQKQQVPITNYGILIAYVQGILKRSVEPFPSVAMELEE